MTIPSGLKNRMPFYDTHELISSCVPSWPSCEPKFLNSRTETPSKGFHKLLSIDAGSFGTRDEVNPSPCSFALCREPPIRFAWISPLDQPIATNESMKTESKQNKKKTKPHASRKYHFHSQMRTPTGNRRREKNEKKKKNREILKSICPGSRNAEE